MHPTALPRPVFDVKGWTTRSSFQSLSLTDDDEPSGTLMNFILLRPRRLKFVKFLGAGSFGCVYLAADIEQDSCFRPGDSSPSLCTAEDSVLSSDPRLLKYFAVKCINNRLVSRRKRLLEVNTHRAALGHPGVLDLYACVQQDGWTFLVLEYAHDGDMLQCMNNLNP
ncbi:hypothetical protein FRC09_017672, partial [Ceratobasidium sp. 395]